jgi:hypothetical protein
MKQEILREMKIEMNKMKQEIIEGETECLKWMNKIKQEFNVLKNSEFKKYARDR